jgi:hypothetical protein
MGLSPDLRLRMGGTQSAAIWKHRVTAAPDPGSAGQWTPPRRKPLAKCEKLPDVQSRKPMPTAKAKEPAAVNKLLLRRIMLPPK